MSTSNIHPIIDRLSRLCSFFQQRYRVHSSSRDNRFVGRRLSVNDSSIESKISLTMFSTICVNEVYSNLCGSLRDSADEKKEKIRKKMSRRLPPPARFSLFTPQKFSSSNELHSKILDIAGIVYVCGPQNAPQNCSEFFGNSESPLLLNVHLSSCITELTIV